MITKADLDFMFEEMKKCGYTHQQYKSMVKRNFGMEWEK